MDLLRKLLWMFPGLLLALCAAPRAFAFYETDDQEVVSCGDEKLACGSEERCCEHVTASFAPDGASTPAFVEGRCIPKEQRCADFWCGNRHCKGGLFGTPSVCCVSTHPGAADSYQCAYSELSCPGNSQQLTIRSRTPEKNLQGS